VQTHHLTDTGMELRDLLTDPNFPVRNRGRRTTPVYLEAVGRLAQVFAQTPELLLQELVESAVLFCGADSSGISLEVRTEKGERQFRWVAVAGSFAQYVHAEVPRFFSPCGTCLDTERPQLYRVTQPYYEFLGITAEDITDGMLIPWINEHMRGTIWAVAHHSREAFDMEDFTLLTTLAAFASMGLRHQHQQQLLRENEKEAASAARANELAHQINNPLQGLINTLYLANRGGADVQEYVGQALHEVGVLSDLVGRLLNAGDKRRNGIAA
jgi:signal transduction histidine kinase